MSKISKAIELSPRILSTSIIGLWMTGLILIYGFGPLFFAGMFISLILISTTLMAWRTEVFGGFIFIVESIIVLLASLSKINGSVYVICALALFITGVSFLGDYIYHEHHHATAEDDF